LPNFETRHVIFEATPKQRQECTQDRHVDNDANPADRPEQRKPRRHDPTEPLVVESNQELENDSPVELAFPFPSGCKTQWTLAHAQRLLGGSEDVERDLATATGEPIRIAADTLGADHEEAAHRVGPR